MSALDWFVIATYLVHHRSGTVDQPQAGRPGRLFSRRQRHPLVGGPAIHGGHRDQRRHPSWGPRQGIHPGHDRHAVLHRHGGGALRPGGGIRSGDVESGLCAQRQSATFVTDFYRPYLRPGAASVHYMNGLPSVHRVHRTAARLRRLSGDRPLRGESRDRPADHLPGDHDLLLRGTPRYILRGAADASRGSTLSNMTGAAASIAAVLLMNPHRRGRGLLSPAASSPLPSPLPAARAALSWSVSGPPRQMPRRLHSLSGEPAPLGSEREQNRLYAVRHPTGKHDDLVKRDAQHPCTRGIAAGSMIYIQDGGSFRRTYFD